jgi:hypothetical protein
MTGYYDLVLGLIPLTLAGVTAALVVTGVQVTMAIPLASLLSVALIGHAMFVRTPGTSSVGAAGQDSAGMGVPD